LPHLECRPVAPRRRLRRRRVHPSAAAGCCVCPGPRSLRVPAIGRWKWHPSGWAHRRGITPPPRLGWRARRERARFCRHEAAIADPAGPAYSSPGVGEVPLFNLHNYRIVAMLGIKEVSIVALGMDVDTGAGSNLVHRNALSPTGCARWGPPVRRSRSDSDTPSAHGCVPAVPSRCDFRRASGLNPRPSSSSTYCR